jgi:protein O-GlcNAc transferase
MIQFIIVGIFFRVIRSSKFRWLMNRKFPRAFFFPRMTREEFVLLADATADAKTIIEYGSGGSTVWFLRQGKRIFSVDSNPGFHELMMSIPFVSRHVGRNLNLDFVDIGPTDTWGTPLSKDRQFEWPRYVAQPWTRVDGSVPVDIVLVDGRFRVACALHSVQRIRELGWTSARVLIHDFWDRPEYHVVLPFLKEEKARGTLGVFSVREDVDPVELDRLIREYQAVPR